MAKQIKGKSLCFCFFFLTKKAAEWSSNAPLDTNNEYIIPLIFGVLIVNDLELTGSRPLFPLSRPKLFAQNSAV